MSDSHGCYAAMSLVMALIVLVLSGATGCGIVVRPAGQAGALGSGIGATGVDGATSSPGASAAGALEPGSDGSIPGAIGGSGASGSNPPISALPAPQGSQDRIRQLIQRFGMKSITGSGATDAKSEAIEHVAEIMAYHLCNGQGDSPDLILRGFQFPGDVRQIVSRKLGSAVGQSS
ncbi:MAG: hypothetical protein HY815_32830 [Candidatus Riflebacteria bacterium]|nr:hypothetical protein [Candidatus Riflebacteria bacterium]